MIPQRNLSLLSNELARQGGQRIPEAVLERDYCLSWFLVGISQTRFLQEILVFKGGTAIKKCYIPDYRFSEDLDFTPEIREPVKQIQPVRKKRTKIKPPALHPFILQFVSRISQVFGCCFYLATLW